MNHVADPELVESGHANGATHRERAHDAIGRRVRRSRPSDANAVRALAQLSLRFTNLLPQSCFNRVRTALWRAAEMSIGEGSLLMGDVLLSGAGDFKSLLSIGDETYMRGPLRIDLGGEVRIGNRVDIDANCAFFTVDHEVGPPHRRAGLSTYGSIVIGDGVWIASRVTILPGVTIGDGAVLGAGAVVVSDVEPNTLVGGVPARVLRKLEAERANERSDPEGESSSLHETCVDVVME
jgi:maltose O-acetyltransferase